MYHIYKMTCCPTGLCFGSELFLVCYLQVNPSFSYTTVSIVCIAQRIWYFCLDLKKKLTSRKEVSYFLFKISFNVYAQVLNNVMLKYSTFQLWVTGANQWLNIKITQGCQGVPVLFRKNTPTRSYCAKLKSIYIVFYAYVEDLAEYKPDCPYWCYMHVPGSISYVCTCTVKRREDLNRGACIYIGHLCVYIHKLHMFPSENKISGIHGLMDLLSYKLKDQWTLCFVLWWAYLMSIWSHCKAIYFSDKCINSYSASHDNWCTVTLWNRIMTAQCEGMGEVGSARYEPALLPPCPSIRVLGYSNCQRSTHSSRRAWQCKC